MTLSRRNVRVGVLLVWTGIFAYLWATSEVLRYLGPRTEWVVPFGAIALGLVTFLYAATSEEGEDMRRRPERGDWLGAAGLLVPAVVVLVMANASLGSMAASRKLTSRGIDVGKLAGLLASHAGQISFLELRTASDHPDFASSNDIRPGRQVKLTGFVMQKADATGRPFRLARFYITCCVADSIPIDVEIDPVAAVHVPAYARDTWLDVAGAIVRRGKGFAVQGERVQQVAQPHDPYLSFVGETTQ